MNCNTTHYRANSSSVPGDPTAQLGIHTKPCGLVNVSGYYSTFLTFLDEMVSRGFLKPEHRSLVLVEDDPQLLLDRFRSYKAPPTNLWLEPEIPPQS